MRGRSFLPGQPVPAEFSAGQEFIDREQQFPPDFNAGPADMARAKTLTADMYATPPGEPPSDFDVRSIYDSRPVNAYDFNLVGNSGEIAAGPNSATVLFTVPNGFVAIPRKWIIWYEPGVVFTSPSDSLATIITSGADLPYNADIPIDDYTDSPLETFYVVNENQEFGVRIAYSDAVPANTIIFVHVYGNLLPKVGAVAPQFQVANEVRIRTGSGAAR